MIPLWVMTVCLVLWAVLPTAQVRRRFGWRLFLILGVLAWIILFIEATQGR